MEYIFKLKRTRRKTKQREVKTDVVDLKQYDNIIYTDGACHNNNNSIFSTAGYATYFAKGYLEGYIKYSKVAPLISEGKIIYGTNNRGEGLAILLAVKNILKERPNQNTLIVTDSMFWKI